MILNRECPKYFIDGTRDVARRGLAVTGLLATTVLGACAARPGSSTPASTPAPTVERDVLIGGLFALTGDWSSLSRTDKAAMEIAVEDINRYLAGGACN